MLTKSQINHIKQLSDKKYRELVGEFVVEGEKLFLEALGSGWTITQIILTESCLQRLESKIPITITPILIKESELARVSHWQSPQPIITTVRIPSKTDNSDSGFQLVLDRVQDPGNVGTIIRIADWFGMKQLYMNQETADCFNPKVIQASMGSIFRVICSFVDIPTWLASRSHRPIYAATLHGQPLAMIPKTNDGIVVVGNESKGISSDILKQVTQEITIPALGGAESLNVSVATGIICYHLLS